MTEQVTDAQIIYTLITPWERRGSGPSRCRLLGEELLHVADLDRRPIRRQALQKRLTVALAANARVQQHQDASVFKRANEPAEPLLQREHSRWYLIVEEWLASGLFDCLHARLHHRIVRHGEGQPVDDDATERFTLHVHALPEARRPQEHGIGSDAELIEQGLTRRRSVQEDRIVQHRQQALVEIAHLCIAREEAEGASAADLQHAANTVGCSFSKLR